MSLFERTILVIALATAVTTAIKVGSLRRLTGRIQSHLDDHARGIKDMEDKPCCCEPELRNIELSLATTGLTECDDETPDCCKGPGPTCGETD